jgi:CHAT domain-containing protein
MSLVKCRWWLFMGCWSLIAFIVSASFTQSTQSADEAALRALVEKFYAAYQKEDLDGFMGLWSEKSPDFAQRKQAMQQFFTTDNHTFANLTVSRVKVEEGKASLRVAVDLTAVNAQTKQERKDRVVRNFAFIKERGTWKVWRDAPAEDDLAAALLTAKTEADRQALMATEKELMTGKLVEALRRRGLNLYLRGDPAESLTVFRIAQKIAEQIEEKEGLARVLNNIGAVHETRGDYRAALEFYQQSLELSETLGDKAGIARALNNMGIVYKEQGNYVEALEFYQKALAQYEALKDNTGIARALNNIGVVHKQQGNYDLALEFYQKSLTMREAVGDRNGVASTLNNLGSVYHSQGNYRKALEFYQKSLAQFEASGNKEGAAAVMGNIGLIHEEQGHYAQAMEFHQKSLAQFEGLGNQSGIAKALGNIGNVYDAVGNFTQALECYQKSLAIRKALNDRDGIARMLNDMGVTYRTQRDYARAMEFYQESLKIKEVLGDKPLIASTLNNIGEIYLLQGNPGSALEFCRRSLMFADAIGDPDAVFRCYWVMGDAYRAQGRQQDAIAAYQKAIATIEALRHQVAGGEQEQQRFFENKVAPYHAMVELLIEQYRRVGDTSLMQALTYAERAKARTLLDVLHSGRVNITKAMTAEELEKARTLNNKLVSLNAQILRESQRSQPDQTHLANLKANLQKVRLDYEAFQTSLYAAHPQLKTQRGEAKPITLEETNALLPDAKTALLEFVVTETKTYLFVITIRDERLGMRDKNSAGSRSSSSLISHPSSLILKVYPLNVKQKDLADRVTRLREQLANRDLKVRASARQLYDLLLKPAHAQWQGKTNLVIVPDGVLWELPFQALQPRENHYLIEDAALSYAPSLTVLREMMKQRRHGNKTDSNTPTLQHSNAPATLLAFGNPALGKETVERVQLVQRGETLGALPHAEAEVKLLAQMYGGGSKAYVGAEAREERVKAEAGQYRVLHFATHGLLNDRSPMYSQVMLSQAQGNANEDGLLEAWELMNLNLTAEMVVLSACETARGRVGAGEGVIGLTWALFVAGCPTTVVSQWKVRDDSTSQLMLEFHRRLRTQDAGRRTASKAEALRQAQLKLLRSNDYAHPFFWAGFVLVGDGR